MKFNSIKCYVMTISLPTKYRITHDYVLHDTTLPAVNQLSILELPYITILNVISTPPQLSLKLAKPWDFLKETLNWLYKDQRISLLYNNTLPSRICHCSLVIMASSRCL